MWVIAPRGSPKESLLFEIQILVGKFFFKEGILLIV